VSNSPILRANFSFDIKCFAKRPVRPDHLRPDSAGERRRSAPERGGHDEFRWKRKVHAGRFRRDRRTNQSSKFQTGETGTYKVNSDCTGSARINYKSDGWIDLELVVVNQGSEFRTVVSVLNMGGKDVPANIGSSGTRVDSADADTQNRN
jgi:hypothetical protein